MVVKQARSIDVNCGHRYGFGNAKPRRRAVSRLSLALNDAGMQGYCRVRPEVNKLHHINRNSQERKFDVRATWYGSRTWCISRTWST